MSETTSRMVEATFKAPQISDWERHRALITKLYREEAKPLKEVMSILREQHGVHATSRMYKQRFKDWGMSKNLKSGDLDRILRHYTKEELQTAVQTGRDSTFMLDGRPLSRSAVQRYLQRIRPAEISAGCSMSSSTGLRSDGFIFASTSTLPCTRNDQSSLTLASISSSSSRSSSRLATPVDFMASTHRAYRGTKDSAFSQISLASPSAISDKASTVGKGTNENEDEETNATRKRRRVSATNSTLSSETKVLACPFYKHDPQRYSPQNKDIYSAMRYRTCAGPGWESISRLRQHLFRAHKAPKPCGTCNSILQSRTDLEHHARDCHGTVALDMIATSETIPEAQRYQLKQKHLPSMTKEESWMRIYHVLFPNDSSVPTPYYQSDNEGSRNTMLTGNSFRQVDSLVQHLCDVLPEKIFKQWEGQPEKQANAASPGTAAGAAQKSAENLGRYLSRTETMQSERFSEADKSNNITPSASVHGLKALISESVAETCTEWLRNHKEQDDDSGQESEDPIEQSHHTSSLADRQELSVASVTTAPDQWGWQPEIQEVTEADISLSPFDYYQPLPSHVYWPPPPQPSPSNYGALNSSMSDSISSRTAAHFELMNSFPATGLQFSNPSMQPDMAQSGTFQGTVGSPFGNSSALGSLRTCWRDWELMTIPEGGPDIAPPPLPPPRFIEDFADGQGAGWKFANEDIATNRSQPNQDP